MTKGLRDNKPFTEDGCKPVLNSIAQHLFANLQNMGAIDFELEGQLAELERECLKYLCQKQGILDLTSDEISSLELASELNHIHANDPISFLPIGRSLVRKLNLSDIQSVKQLSQVTPSSLRHIQELLNMQGPQRQQFSTAVDRARRVVARDLLANSSTSQTLTPILWQSICTQHQQCMDKTNKKIEIATSSQIIVDDAIRKIDELLAQTKPELETIHRHKRPRKTGPSPEQLPLSPFLPPASPTHIRNHTHQKFVEHSAIF